MNFDLSGWHVVLVIGGIFMSGLIGYVFGYAEGRDRPEDDEQD